MTRHDDAAAADLLDREGVRDDVAETITDGEVRGGRVERRGIAGRDGDRTGGRADESPALRRVGVRAQTLQRHAYEVGFGDVMVAIALSVPRRLQHQGN